MSDGRALAWMVVDPAGRRSIFLDEGRADLAAARQRGIKVDLFRADGRGAVAWLIVNSRGGRFVVLQADRAEQMARDVHGQAVGLAPAVPLSEPAP